LAAAKICEPQCDIIDLNFGCPYPAITQQGAGSALLKRPNKIGEIVAAVSSAVSLPVTCKIRAVSGKQEIGTVEIAKICEKSGAAMLTGVGFEIRSEVLNG